MAYVLVNDWASGLGGWTHSGTGGSLSNVSGTLFNSDT